MKCPLQPLTIQRWSPAAAVSPADDYVAVEEPLEVRVEGRPVAVTMRTPGHDEELAVGFLVSEGVVARADDLLEVNRCPTTAGTQGNAIDVLLRRPQSADFAQLTRHVFSASSCGLCGKASIDALRTRFPALSGPSPVVTVAALQRLPERLAQAQPVFQQTGALHAAALFDAEGELLVVREDVGRHNAVDKVVGWLLRNTCHPAPVGLFVSGRVSFEVVQKALAARLSVIAAISAPTSLAVEFARANGQTLIGFLRPERFNVYAGQVAA